MMFYLFRLPQEQGCYDGMHYLLKDTFFYFGDMSNNLPLSQTPSLKRIYTKAHSLNLHHPGLCPEATKRGYGNKKKEDKEKEETVQHRLDQRPRNTHNENL